MITEVSHLRELVADLDHILGTDGNFWTAKPTMAKELESPEQVKELATDLLVTLFGLEVRGL